MKYYVGIRETMINRARAASSATLAADFITNPLQQEKNHKNDIDADIATYCKPLWLQGLLKSG